MPVVINDTKEIYSPTGITVGDLKNFLEQFNDDCPIVTLIGDQHNKPNVAKWNATTPGLGLNSEAILFF